MQRELEEKMIAAKKLEADMALYRSRGPCDSQRALVRSVQCTELH